MHCVQAEFTHYLTQCMHVHVHVHVHMRMRMHMHVHMHMHMHSGHVTRCVRAVNSMCPFLVRVPCAVHVHVHMHAQWRGHDVLHLRMQPILRVGGTSPITCALQGTLHVALQNALQTRVLHYHARFGVLHSRSEILTGQAR